MGGLTLKVKTKQGQHILKDLTDTDTIDTLKTKLSELTSISTDRLSVLIGFPPKHLNITEDLSSTLATRGVTNGDTLIVDEKAAAASSVATIIANSAPVTPAAGDGQADDAKECVVQSAGILLKRVVPSDNSCLFTSIGFLLNGRVDPNCATYMRKLIAGQVEKDKETFSEAVLGRPNKDYCEWIKKSDSWGGAIEISILSSHYGMEIAVVDISNAIINRFGEDKNYGSRSFLLFDGIHYDPLYLEQAINGEAKTVFQIEDEEVMRQAKQLAVEAKSSRQFTDVDKFTLKCNQCNVMLMGQVQAQQHAKSTGHTDFGEV